jgi:hypothetical protein
MFLKTKKSAFRASKHLTQAITGQYNHAASRNVIHSTARDKPFLRDASEPSGMTASNPCCA